MLAQEAELTCENGMDDSIGSESRNRQLGKTEKDSCREVLASFRSHKGFQIQVVEFREFFFQELVRMYEEFEPKRGAQGLPPIGRDRLISWLRPLCDNNLNLIALFQDRIIGHAMLCPMRGDSAEFAIFIHQDFRNQGIGFEFTRNTLEYGRSRGLRHIWLTVEVNNFSAVRVYKKIGFEISSTYYPEVEMALDLEEGSA